MAIKVERVHLSAPAPTVAANDPEKALHTIYARTHLPPLTMTTSQSTMISHPYPSDLYSPRTSALITWASKTKVDGRDRRTLTYEGYRSLSIVATFLAAVQSQLLSTSTGPSSKLVTALYFTGLITDILSAALCFLSARWFEMLNEEEAQFLQQCWEANDRNQPLPHESTQSLFIDQWVRFGIRAACISVWSGFGFLMAGVLCNVWFEQPEVVGITVTTVFTILALFVFPFTLTHSRRSVLSRLGIKRVSGTT